MIRVALFLIIVFFFFLKSIILIVCSVKNSKYLSIRSLPLHSSCLFPMLLNEDIVDIEEPDGIYLLHFFSDEFSGLFLHPSIFSIIHSKSA